VFGVGPVSPFQAGWFDRQDQAGSGLHLKGMALDGQFWHLPSLRLLLGEIDILMLDY
jgi:hypothetical protein